MSFGEVTITLDDVHCLTSLPIRGLPVLLISREDKLEDWKMVSKLFGVPKKDVKAAISGVRGSSLKLEWLKSTFQKFLTSSDETLSPYTPLVREMYPFDPVTLFHSCLYEGDVVEPYIPEQVLMQYGYVQTIPLIPIGFGLKRTNRVSKSKQNVLITLAQHFGSWDVHTLTNDHLRTLLGNLYSVLMIVSKHSLSYFKAEIVIG
ncbi:hypothetical protein ACS0TY_018428 [Phlomoides rotata]